MTSWLRVLVLALALTLIPLGIGMVLVIRDRTDPGPAAYESTALASYDTSTVRITRSPFCDRIAPEAVTAALDGEASSDEAWNDGDEAPGVGQITHEFGCQYAGDAEAEASAWVVAPPISVERAGRLTAEAATERGCQALPDAPAFGDPSVAISCSGPQRSVVSSAACSATRGSAVGWRSPGR